MLPPWPDSVDSSGTINFQRPFRLRRSFADSLDFRHCRTGQLQHLSCAGPRSRAPLPPHGRAGGRPAGRGAAQRVQHAERLISAAADVEVVHDGVLQHAVGIDDEQSTRRTSLCLQPHAIVAAHGAVRGAWNVGGVLPDDRGAHGSDQQRRGSGRRHPYGGSERAGARGLARSPR